MSINPLQLRFQKKKLVLPDVTLKQLQEISWLLPQQTLSETSVANGAEGTLLDLHWENLADWKAQYA